jgi:hypothetical protein
MSEIQAIETRLREFVACRTDPDWQDVVRRAALTTPIQRPWRPFRRRGIVLALAAACAAVAVPAVVFSGAFRSSAPPESGPSPTTGHPIGYDPMNLQFTHSGSEIRAIAVTVNAPTRDATMLLQVITGSPYGHIVSPATRKIVFQEQVPMTNIVSPASGPNGTAALSTWSGTLSPSDWDGGCQHALYEVYATTVTSGASFDNPPSGSQIVGSQWFTCNGN